MTLKSLLKNWLVMYNMKRTELRAFIQSSTVLDSAVIDVIREAARDLRIVTITYQDSKGMMTLRDVEPYEIKDGKLWAYCLLSGAIRQFTLGRILHIEILDATYRPRWAVKIL